MRRYSGVTALELLIILAILAACVSVLLLLIGVGRESSRQSSCLANQHKLYLAINTWATVSNIEVYPQMSMAWKCPGVNPQILHCPAQQALTATQGEGANDYGYSKFLAGKSFRDVRMPASEIFLVDVAPLGKEKTETRRIANIFAQPADLSFRHKNGVVATFADGHAEWLREPPPYWVVAITSALLFDQEVLRTRYPVLVLFSAGQDYVKDGNGVEVPGLSRRIILELCKRYRARVKIVVVDGKEYPQLLSRYQIGSASSFPTTVVLFKGGRQVKRIAASGTGEPTAFGEVQTLYNNISAAADALAK